MLPQAEVLPEAPGPGTAPPPAPPVLSEGAWAADTLAPDFGSHLSPGRRAVFWEDRSGHALVALQMLH